MKKRRVDWKGYWPAASTPFTRDGLIDEPAWRNLLRLYLQQGVHGVLVNGTTGEWFSQTDGERRKLAEIAVAELKGKIPVVVGCTTFTPRDTAELGRHAASIGADGMLSTPPPYAVPTDREVVAFYRYVADRVDLPIMIYNWARGTNVEIRGSLAVELAQIEGVVAFKDSTANKEQFLETLTAVVSSVLVFGGFVSTQGLRTLQTVGGSGSIDGGGLGAPMAVAFYEAVWHGDLTAARAHGERYVQLMEQLINPDWSGVFGSPQAQLKAAMNILGQPGGFPRLPLLPVDDPADVAGLRKVLQSAGLVAENDTRQTRSA
jgi:1-pyrroline-4-hydroxy-2-carboxylate deaminase